MPKKRKAKQDDLPAMEGPGVERISIKEIDDLAEDYIKTRDRWVAASAPVQVANDKLREAIHKHADKIGKDRNGEIVYRYDNVVVLLKPGKESLKVKTVEAFEEDNIY